MFHSCGPAAAKHQSPKMYVRCMTQVAVSTVPHPELHASAGYAHCPIFLMSSANMASPLSPVHTSDKVEFNTVDFVESRLLPKPATKSTVAVYIQLCCQFWQQIGKNMNSTVSCKIATTSSRNQGQVFGFDLKTETSTP